MKNSFIFKIFLVFVAAVLLIFSVFTAILAYRQYHALRENLLKTGESVAELLAYSVRTGVFAENKGILKNVIHGAMLQKDVLSVIIADAQGKVLMASRRVQNNRYVVETEATGIPPIPYPLPGHRGIEIREVHATVEFTKPVLIEAMDQYEISLYFDNDNPERSYVIAGFIKIILDKTVVYSEIYSILIRNAIILLFIILAGTGAVFVFLRRITMPLSRLTGSVVHLGEGEPFVYDVPPADDEIGKLAKALMSMYENLCSREREKSTLQEENVRTLERMVSEERRHNIEKETMLKDLHDGLGGIITGIKLLSEIALELLSRIQLPSRAPCGGQEKNDPALFAHLAKVLTTLLERAEEGRSEIKGFMQSLDGRDWGSLIAEMRLYGQQVLEPHHISFTLTHDISVPDRTLSSSLFLTLFKIFREALTNVTKHAQAVNVFVSFSVSPEKLILALRDDGIGLKEPTGRGRGIPNMKSRGESVGGTVSVYTDKGTVVRLEIRAPFDPYL